MRTFGLYLIIFSLISIVLALIGFDLPIINKLDSWGLPKGLLIRIALLMIGFFLMANHKEKLPEEQFPELKEINNMSKADNSEGDLDATEG
ncbi:MAG: hypothetical protein KG003_04215 [Bacteroidetes bacterium]|nr:hypothetical protein [Bacteroidota bacterium]